MRHLGENCGRTITTATVNRGVRTRLPAWSDDGNVVGTHLAFVHPSNASVEIERRVETEE
jgi:hypothetical protein